MSPKFALTKHRFLLCEGEDDKAVLEAIITAHQLPEFQVCHAAESNQKKQGGRNGFRETLDTGFAALTGFDQLAAILVVSDNDNAAAFGKVQDEFTAAGHAPPQTQATTGLVHGKPTAVLLIPTNSYGDLETLCLPEIHRVWPNAQRCVNDFMNCSGANHWRKASSISKARARAAAVGFNEDDPYKGIGVLFRKGTLSPNHNCFDPIVQFLRGFDALVGI